MKSNYTKLIILFIFLFSIENIKAQTCWDVKVPTTSTPAFCGNEGTIRIMEEYLDSNLSNFQYTISLNGAVLAQQSNPLFTGLAQGEYSIDLTATCTEPDGTTTQITGSGYQSVEGVSNLYIYLYVSNTTGSTLFCSEGGNGTVTVNPSGFSYDAIKEHIKYRLTKPDGTIIIDVQTPDISQSYAPFTFENVPEGEYKAQIVYPCSDGSYILLTETDVAIVGFSGLKTETTESHCWADGTITVTLEGPDSNTIPSGDIIYKLMEGQTVLSTQNSNIFLNVGVGTYTVEMQAICTSGKQITKTAENVVVAGAQYDAMTADFGSRGSYSSPNCITGLINLGMKGGWGDFTFVIESAPTGVSTGAVTATKGTTTNGITTYTLDGLYPAGDYTIRAYDACNNSIVTSGTIALLNDINISYSLRTPWTTDATDDCNLVYMSVSTPNSSSSPDLYAHYIARMYEYALVEYPNTPVESDWKEFYGAKSINLPAGRTIADFYNVSGTTRKQLRLYRRVKGTNCVYQSSPFYLTTPSMTLSTYTSTGCTAYEQNIYGPYLVSPYQVVCFPLSLEVKDSGGNTVYTKNNWAYSGNSPISNNSGFLTIPNLDTNESYTLTLTTNDGYKMTSTIAQKAAAENFSLVSSGNNYKKCDTYQIGFVLRFSCPTLYILYKKLSDGTRVEVERRTLSIANTINLTTDLEYGVTYEITFDGVTKYTTMEAASPYNFDNLTINATHTANTCIENNGQLTISAQGGSFAPGTKFTITGPAGFTTQTRTLTTPTISVTFPQLANNYINIPPGNYTYQVIDGCDPSKTYTTTRTLELYRADNISYDQLEQTCNGLKVTFSGSITNNGTPVTTYCHIVSGPAGVGTSTLSTGSLTLASSGTYVIGYATSSINGTCKIKQETIVYTPKTIALKQGNEGVVANGRPECLNDIKSLTVNIEGGVAPYRYELRTADGATLIESIVSSNTQVTFTLNREDVTTNYRLIVTDQCTNNLTQTIEVADLYVPQLASAYPSALCIGEAVQLECVDLNVSSSYNWQGPAGSGFTSTTRNPIIINVNESNRGWYTMTVSPDYCQNVVTDSVYVDVYPPLSIESLTDDHIVCFNSPSKTLSCEVSRTDPATLTYQWQTSPDGLTWTDVSGANTANYLPPSGLDKGLYYYRVIVSSRCGTVESGTITVEVKSCNVLVNPHLRLRVIDES